MKNNAGKGNVILRVVLSIVLFSVFIKIDTLFSIMNILAERGWPLLVIIFAAVMIRMIFAGLVVLIIIPPILGFKRWQGWLPGFLAGFNSVVMHLASKDLPSLIYVMVTGVIYSLFFLIGI